MSRLKDPRFKNLLIIFLLITNLATIGTFLLMRARHGHGPPERHHHRMINRFIQEELGLSAPQKRQLEEIREAFEQKKRAHFEQMRTGMNGLLQKFAEGTSDRSALLPQADTIAALHREMALLQIDQYLATREACTPEQQEKLQGLYQRLLKMELERKGPP